MLQILISGIHEKQMCLYQFIIFIFQHLNNYEL